jgi:hypothetical protein
MSADNWARCPRCYRRGIEDLKTKVLELKEAYGVVPIGQFDQMNADLERDRRALERFEDTFREDYEFYGADTGVVKVAYGGRCTKCGLILEFQEEHPIHGIDQ